MSNSVRKILSQLEQTRQDLLDLSDEIWENIDQNDMEALEKGYQFMKAYNEATDELAGVTDDIEKLLREFTQNFHEEESGPETTRNVGEWPNPEEASVEIRDLDDDLRYTYPQALHAGAFMIRGVDHWSDLLREVCDHLSDEHPDRFDEAAEADRFESDHGRRYFTREPDELRVPEEVTDGVYAEMNLSANDVASRIAELLDFLDYEADAAEVRVETRND